MVVPSQGRSPAALDEVEQAVARTADLVLKLTALAERYEGGQASAARVQRMREAADAGRQALDRLARPTAEVHSA